MKIILSFLLSVVFAVALLITVLTPRLAIAGGTVGDGTPASCTETTLKAALTGGGVVTFNCGADPVTIVLGSQQVITQNTAIDGAGKITLSGISATRLFSISSGVSLNLSDLTLSDGSASQGGAIYNNGQLTIVKGTLSNNSAPGGTGGAICNLGAATIMSSTLSGNIAGAGLSGSIDNRGTLTVINSKFIGNFAGYAGGAIGNNGTASIRYSSFNDNQSPGGGGAIDNFGSLTIDNSTFFSNTASSGSGGVIYNGDTLTITHSTFYTNTSQNGGGGIFNGGSLSLTDSTFLGNKAQSGGGVYNEVLSPATIYASTFAGNTALGGLGGGIYNNGRLSIIADTLAGNGAAAGLGGAINNDISGTLTVINSTFSDNFGGFSGGGIIAGGPVTVTNSTVYSNTAGGLVNGGTAAFKVKNTIVANNTSNNCFGAITSLGHNLEDTNTCMFTATGDQPNTNPRLGPLANNGGPTLTHAPLPSSPAINAGDNVGCPATDQRGIPRPQYGVCDIGAVEFVIRVYLPFVLK